MKLRLRGNSIRLRLTRSEVEEFGRSGKIEERVEFGPGKLAFTYAIETDAEGPETSAEFSGNRLCVHVGRDTARRWVDTDDVGIASNASVPRILIEKDFACLTSRPHEDESDTYPNPGNSAR
jgi:hypothetical protein